VRYWESRCEVFGPDKFCLQMKLSEALLGDAVALNAGVFTLLPKRDSSGRHLVYVESKRHTSAGYDVESCND
jgi:hypothetical protein